MKIEFTSDDRPLVTDFDPTTGRPLVNVVTGEPIAELIAEQPAPVAEPVAEKAPAPEPVAEVAEVAPAAEEAPAA